MVRRLLLFLFGAALLFSGNLAIAESLNLGINTVVEIGTNFISFGQFPNGCTLHTGTRLRNLSGFAGQL